MSVVQMTNFGQMGRWGNQIFQYAFLNLYAERYGATVEIPAWAGDAIYGVPRQSPTEKLPLYYNRKGERHYEYPPIGNEVVDHDYCGYGQFHTSWYALHKDKFRSYFQPNQSIVRRLAPALSRLQRHNTTVGLHIRRGDYGRSIFYITLIAWYLQLLSHIWPLLNDPILFIATEDLSLTTEFNAYLPVTTQSLGVDLNSAPLMHYNYLPHDLQTHELVQMDFFPDFYFLSHCDIVIAPNSTFSFAAAMMNPHLQKFYRSELETQRFVELDVWNSRPLTHVNVNEFPEVPGVRLDSNPWW